MALEDRPPGITPRPGDGRLGDFTLPLGWSDPGRDTGSRGEGNAQPQGYMVLACAVVAVGNDVSPARPRWGGCRGFPVFSTLESGIITAAYRRACRASVGSCPLNVSGCGGPSPKGADRPGPTCPGLRRLTFWTNTPRAGRPPRTGWTSSQGWKRSAVPLEQLGAVVHLGWVVAPCQPKTRYFC